MLTTIQLGARQIGKFLFPTLPDENESPEEGCARITIAHAWEPVFRWRAIHWKCLLVAKTRIEGKWACYATPVPGKNHNEEYRLWETEGVKLDEGIARSAFPEFEGVPYAH